MGKDKKLTEQEIADLWAEAESQACVLYQKVCQLDLNNSVILVSQLKRILDNLYANKHSAAKERKRKK